MALQIKKTSPQGIDVNYYRISGINLNVDDATVLVIVDGYPSKAIRDRIPAPTRLTREVVNFGPEAIDKSRADLYPLLKGAGQMFEGATDV